MSRAMSDYGVQSLNTCCALTLHARFCHAGVERVVEGQPACTFLNAVTRTRTRLGEEARPPREQAKRTTIESKRQSRGTT